MKLKGKNAISLIVLVITIIVLSILAATVIISLSNTNIISEVSKTTFKSDMSSYKEAYEMYVASELAKNAEFDRTTLNLTYQDDEFSKIFGNVSDRYKEGLKVVDGVLVYESEDETENEVLNEVGMIPKISKKKSYVGYFADVDGDGTVDGVIFADLCIGEQGVTVSESDVKDYEITQEAYSVTDAPGLGTHPVLTATGDGEDRFYVMELKGYGRRYPWISESDNLGFQELALTSSDFGMGKANTELLLCSGKISCSGYENDSIWDQLYREVTYNGQSSMDLTRLDGWFVPSIGEWSAFWANCFDYCLGDLMESYGMTYGYYISSSAASEDGKVGTFYPLRTGEDTAAVGVAVGTDVECYVRLARMF